ncbi:MAG: LysR substrate-binding domain-containing protein [Propionivibrio sp.]
MNTHTPIDLRQLRYFLAVADELNFGRAAERLHISQPPLSRQIRQLEEQLGVELLQRSKTGVALTPSGAAFLPEARRTLTQAQKAVAVARAARGTDGGQFVVGYTTVFDRSAFPDIFERWRELHPEWRLVLKGKHSISLIRDLRNGVMDAAFIGLHTQADGLTVETLTSEPLIVALPAHHRLAAKRRIGFDDLRGEPMFWFERRLNPGFHDYCRAFFERIDFVPNAIVEPADHHVLLGLIAEGQGVALIPASLQAVRRAGVFFRPLQNETPEMLAMGVAVAYAPGNRSPMLRPFLNLVRASVESIKGSPARPAAGQRTPALAPAADVDPA